MIHVLLRVAVWVIVLAIGYLLIGPGVFDSSPADSPFQSDSKIFLPPAKSQRQFEYDEIQKERSLNAEESAEYRKLVQERESRFWQQQGVSVEEALSGVKTQRKARLAEILQERGMSREEAAVFFLVLERDHPELLADRE
ncbi:MAG: hypothetical protein LJE59_07635 [Chromatiaceae bacterium]|jgi:hypothetical protein|nr:hypothetical protein [Chromatiaceae bacterium]